MTTTTNRTRYFLDIDQTLRNHVKAAAALQGKTMKEWLTEAITEKLEDEMDEAIALKAMSETDGLMTLADFKKKSLKAV